jgi:ribonuclease HII
MKKPLWVIGIDEVGRGPLAGPVTMCAVALPFKNYKKNMWKGLTDSKKMTAKSRTQWYLETEFLSQEYGMTYALASRTAKQIDTKGIVVCIRECIQSMLKELNLDPTACLVLLDGGLKAPAEYIHQQTIIKGDSKEQVISLASVIAKVSRDEYMKKQDKKYPQYGWLQNKGYGTKSHREAIGKNGITPFHRKSFLTRII